MDDSIVMAISGDGVFGIVNVIVGGYNTRALGVLYSANCLV